MFRLWKITWVGVDFRAANKYICYGHSVANARDWQ